MKKQGFTLIELIVVITILTILGTIAFISFKGFSSDSRDAKVISDTTNIHKGLTLYKTTNGKLPMPDNAVTITSGSNPITYEGEIGDSVRNVIRVDNNAKTPTGENYMYATNGNNIYFEVVGLLENEQANILNIAYADANIKYFKGDEILTVFDSDNTFVDSETNIDSLTDTTILPYLGDSLLEVDITNKKVKNVPNEIKENKPYSNLCPLEPTPEKYFGFDEGTNTITSYDIAGGTSVNIPSKIRGLDVKIIGNGVLNNKGLNCVSIPNSVKSIGMFSFAKNNLKSIIIPEGVETIGPFAFSNNKLTSITIPSSVTSIGFSAFTENQLPPSQAFIYERNPDGSENKKKLNSYGGALRNNVVIPDQIEEIGSNSFLELNITSITLPSSLIKIGIGAFRGNQLTNISIPASVIEIGSSSFNDNNLPLSQAFIYKRNVDGTENKSTVVSFGSKLYNSITVPNTVTTIGSQAFIHSNLTSITIPNSVISIDHMAFSWNNLTDSSINIDCNSSISINSNAFNYNGLNQETNISTSNVCP